MTSPQINAAIPRVSTLADATHPEFRACLLPMLC